MGDLFGWLERFTGRSLESLGEAFATTFSEDNSDDAQLLVIDHFNGCRTPLMDGALRGQIHGLSLQTTPESMSVRKLPHACACR